MIEVKENTGNLESNLDNRYAKIQVHDIDIKKYIAQIRDYVDDILDIYEFLLDLGFDSDISSININNIFEI